MSPTEIPPPTLAQDAIGTRLYDLQIPTLGNFCNAELQVSYKVEDIKSGRAWP